MRYQCSVVLLVALVASAAAASPGAAQTARGQNADRTHAVPSRPPNVLLIMADDLNNDLGAHGLRR
jgi:hypothetical protein